MSTIVVPLGTAGTGAAAGGGDAGRTVGVALAAGWLERGGVFLATDEAAACEVDAVAAAVGTVVDTVADTGDLGTGAAVHAATVSPVTAAATAADIRMTAKPARQTAEIP